MQPGFFQSDCPALEVMIKLKVLAGVLQVTNPQKALTPTISPITYVKRIT